VTALLEVRNVSKIYGGSLLGKRDTTVALEDLS